MRTFAAVLLAALLVACAPRPLQNVALQWQPSSQLDFGAVTLTGLSHARIQVERFRDVRQNPQLVAENLEDPIPKPVTTTTDVGAFVARHLRSAFDQAGLNTADSGGNVLLAGEVRQFFIRETNTYKGVVVLHLVLRRPTGQTIWEGSVAGRASTFGRSYSMENYNQVFSDAVLDAASALLRNDGFRRALAQV